MLISNCSCGGNDFVIISEKIYEGDIEKGVLECVPECEEITEIRCKNCQIEYNIASFKEIKW